MIENKITFLLPTCEPDEMFKWLLPSLKNIQLAKDYINFAICFQPPYTEEEINKVLEELNNLGFNYKYFCKDYKIVKPYTPLIRMRNDCAMLYPDSLVYGLLDDDMSFESDICSGDLIYILRQFLSRPKLGVMALKAIDRWFCIDNCFATDAGIFYRGGISYGFKGLMPENLYTFPYVKDLIPDYQNENLLELFGGYQDKFCANVRLFSRSEAGILNNVFVNHVQNRKERGDLGHGWIKAQDLDGSIAQFIIKYYNKEFLHDNSMSLIDDRIRNKLLENNYEFYPTLQYSYEIHNKFGFSKVLSKYYVEDYLEQDNCVWNFGIVDWMVEYFKKYPNIGKEYFEEQLIQLVYNLKYNTTHTNAH